MHPRNKAAAAPLLVVAVMFCFSAPARSADVAGSAGMGFFSKYVWRGITVTDGLVLQPSAGVEVSGLTAGIWANMDIDDVNGLSGKFNEVDYTVDYTFSLGEKASVSVGAILYDFPNTTFDATAELYAGVGFGVPGDPSVTIYKDIDEVEGLYASFAGGYGIPLPGGRTLDLGLALGFGDADHNAGYYGVASSGLTDALLTIGSTFEFAEGKFSITPSVALATTVDSDIGDAFDAAGMDTTNVVVGVTLSASF